MPKFRGVYKDAKGRWYFKASTHKDPLTGRWTQATRRGFATAAEAAAAREALLHEVASQPSSTVSGLTVRQLVEQYLDECEATERLGPKSLFDYRHYLDDYIDPWIGSLRVRELSAEVWRAGNTNWPPKEARRPAGGSLPTPSAWPERR